MNVLYALILMFNDGGSVPIHTPAAPHGVLFTSMALCTKALESEQRLRAASGQPDTLACVPMTVMQ